MIVDVEPRRALLVPRRRRPGLARGLPADRPGDRLATSRRDAPAAGRARAARRRRGRRGAPPRGRARLARRSRPGSPLELRRDAGQRARRQRDRRPRRRRRRSAGCRASSPPSSRPTSTRAARGRRSCCASSGRRRATRARGADDAARAGGGDRAARARRLTLAHARTLGAPGGAAVAHPRAWCAAALVVASTTLLVFPLREVAPVVSLGVVYLVAVLLISTVWGAWLGVAHRGRVGAGVQLLPHPADRALHDRRRRELGRAGRVPDRRGDRQLAWRRSPATRATEAEQRRREADLAAEMARLLLRGDELSESLPAAAQRLAPALDLPSAAIELAPVEGDERRVAFPLREGDDAARHAARAGRAAGGGAAAAAGAGRAEPRGAAGGGARARRAARRGRSRRARCAARTSSRPRCCARSRTTCARR